MLPVNPEFLLDARATAVASRIADADLAKHLSDLRANRPEAADAMVDGHLWLVFKFATDRETTEISEEKLGYLYDGLLLAVDRLSRNKRSDVQKFITDELARSMRRFSADKRRCIQAPRSTLAMQRKRAKEAGRTPSLHRDLRGISSRKKYPLRLVDPNAAAARRDQSGTWLNTPDMPPSKRDISVDQRIIDRRIDIAAGGIENLRILELADAGRSVGTISAMTSIPVDQVKHRLQKMRSRAAKCEYRVPQILERPEDISGLLDDRKRQLAGQTGENSAAAAPILSISELPSRIEYFDAYNAKIAAAGAYERTWILNDRFERRVEFLPVKSRSELPKAA